MQQQPEVSGQKLFETFERLCGQRRSPVCHPDAIHLHKPTGLISPPTGRTFWYQLSEQQKQAWDGLAAEVASIAVPG